MTDCKIVLPVCASAADWLVVTEQPGFRVLAAVATHHTRAGCQHPSPLPATTGKVTMERSGRSGLVHWSAVQLPNPLLISRDVNCNKVYWLGWTRLAGGTG